MYLVNILLDSAETQTKLSSFCLKIFIFFLASDEQLFMLNTWYEAYHQTFE